MNAKGVKGMFPMGQAGLQREMMGWDSRVEELSFRTKKFWLSLFVSGERSMEVCILAKRMVQGVCISFG